MLSVTVASTNNYELYKIKTHYCFDNYLYIKCHILRDSHVTCLESDKLHI